MSNSHFYHEEYSLYMVTSTVVGWVDIFTREEYRQILYDSWDYCIKEKGLQIHGYVIMSNHYHLLASSTGEPLGKIIGASKQHTARKIYSLIHESGHESRRNWMGDLFDFVGSTKRYAQNFQVWQHGSRMTALWSIVRIRKALSYIHENPVKAGWVDRPEEYRHSSAKVYAGSRAALVPIRILEGVL